MSVCLLTSNKIIIYDILTTIVDNGRPFIQPLVLPSYKAFLVLLIDFFALVIKKKLG